jgi:hypothetical protein
VKIINTPIYKTEDSREKNVLTAKIGEDNSLTGISKFSFTGAQYDFNLRKISMTEQEIKESLK